MLELGPYIIQSKELVWLKIVFDTQSTPANPKIYSSNFDANANCIPELFQENLLQHSAFKAYDPSTQHYFVIAFTKKGEVLRLRPAAHDVFVNFQLSDEKKQTLPPTFLEKFHTDHWRFV